MRELAGEHVGVMGEVAWTGRSMRGSQSNIADVCILRIQRFLRLRYRGEMKRREHWIILSKMFEKTEGITFVEKHLLTRSNKQTESHEMTANPGQSICYPLICRYQRPKVV